MRTAGSGATSNGEIASLMCQFHEIFDEICDGFCRIGTHGCRVLGAQLNWLTSHFNILSAQFAMFFKG